MSDLNKLSPNPGSTRKRKRIGRGPGSGLGKTSGKGQKGQKARSGGKIPAWFEGGQMPIARRLPKRGFHNNWAKHFAEVNVRDLDRFEAGSVVDIEALQAANLVKNNIGDGVKLLGNGDVDRALTIKVHKISKGAQAKVEAAGGTVELIG
ncbi:MAG: 50S ribosomal protein L15 [Proteobacteria bacterium]|nr:50S ribosomal protein L15 [Pseudomonadota bacterium]